MNSNFIIENFKNPPQKFNLYPFWFLNYILDKNTLKKQIREMKEKGVGGFFIHARSGLLYPAYGSDKWFKIVKFIVEESEKISLNSEIYDEFDCPSGTAGEILPIIFHQHRAKFLKIYREKIKIKNDYFHSIPNGKILKVFGVNNGKIYDLTENIGVIKTGFSYSLNWSSKNYYSIEKDYKHTRAIAFNPNLYIQVPSKGDWGIIVFYLKDEQEVKFTHQFYLDVLNPFSTELFLKFTHEKYKRYIGKNFGKNVHYFFIDEPKMFSQYPWTEKLEEIFKNKYGYSLLSNLYHLVLYKGEKSEKTRIHYREILTQLFKENFILKIKNWCSENNLKLIGHISPEENIIHEGYLVGCLLDLLEFFDIPGTDLIIPAIGDQKHKILNLTVLLPASVSEIKDVPLMCESFACSDWNFTPAIMKKITDWLYSIGVNFLVPHAFFYSIVGLRKFEASPSQFYQWTFWKYYNFYSDYVRRLSYIMQETKPVVKICFLYPIKEIWKTLPDEKKASNLQRKIESITFSLLSNQLRFHFITEEKLKDAVIEKDGIICGKMKYSVLLILKDTYISEDVAKILNKLKNKNFSIIEIKSDEELLKHLQKKKINDFILSGKNSDKIFVNQRKKDGKFFYFLFNTSNKKIEIEIKFKGKKGIEVLDCLTGDIYPYPVKFKNNSTFIKLLFHPFQSFIIAESDRIFQEKEKKLVKKRIYFDKEWDLEEFANYFIIDEWLIKKRKKHRMGKIPCPIYKIFPELFSNKWKETVFGKIPIGKVKEEKIEFETKFKIKDNLKRKVELVIEKSGIIGKFHIYLNGYKLTGFRRKKEYDMFNLVVDITKLIKVGENEIKVVLYTDKLESGIYCPFILKGVFFVKNGEIIPFEDKLLTGSWTEQGIPYFSGTITYKQKIEIEKNFLNAEKILLNFPKIKDVVEVEINGKKVATLLWHPYTIDIKKYLKEGINNFVFFVTNSNYNTFFKKSIQSGILGSPFIEFLFTIKRKEGNVKSKKI
ncbi:MAG: hypothetical protein NC899_03645 [Candidatus Omnitrophica bacterium]|nr:hypothetical protein [Candidatus Omnitrophota bacterium]